ncbi:MAG: hypothetical protein AVDCRST_MAG22-31 [uncultured Rubrobacteraceae bacterium]|uniref:DUF485 domain-containing protein n=1 Tax=uncultured Rubrobacteraceae bacterium TaxID=349277 RepID=A0A6J4NBU0_9ACTN|nr:MAG: hypothetical protein AVDCRST_MAG22-31 [uncultured Rubrobacteraceae bacterium]
MERSAEWARVEWTSAFKKLARSKLARSKKAFLITAMIFFLVFYFGLPFLAGFTTVLNVEVVGPFTLAYVYAFAQFVVTWVLMHFYLNRANRWDELIDRARREAAGEGEDGEVR